MIQEAKQVDVNHATAQELERLPEIGPSLAQRIVEYRSAYGPFRTSEELQRVPGIGPKTYEALKDYVTVR
jgi:competence protein ComEA